MTNLVRTAAVAAIAIAGAAPAFAQTAANPAQAGARPTNPGPAIAGVCTLDEQRAIVTSAAGRAYNTRMQQLTQAVQAELTPQQTSIEAEARRIQALPENQRAQPSQALTPRLTAFQRLAATREAELQATQRRQLQRIATEMQPVVSQVYVQRNCGLLLDGSAVVYANPAMSITDAVVAGLNTRLPTLTFNRETLPAQAAAPAAQPATPAPTRR